MPAPNNRTNAASIWLLAVLLFSFGSDRVRAAPFEDEAQIAEIASREILLRLPTDPRPICVMRGTRDSLPPPFGEDHRYPTDVAGVAGIASASDCYLNNIDASEKRVVLIQSRTADGWKIAAGLSEFSEPGALNYIDSLEEEHVIAETSSDVCDSDGWLFYLRRVGVDGRFEFFKAAVAFHMTCMGCSGRISEQEKLAMQAPRGTHHCSKP